MRRSDREITDFDEIVAVMRKCDVCRLALNTPEGYPYLLPLNFGLSVKDGQVTLFFHGAGEGQKYVYMKADARASFEMDCEHELVMTEKEDGCHCTMKYASVIGRGRISFLTEEEKADALAKLMAQYHGSEKVFHLNEKTVAATTVFKLDVEQMTGKRR